MISREKARAVVSYARVNGLEKASKHFNLTYESISRYKRWYKQYEGTEDT